MPKCCFSGLASCPSKNTPANDKVCDSFKCLDLLSNPVIQWIFIESVSGALFAPWMVCNGCRCYSFLFIVVVIFSIIIALIYKNENPMVCLLALWVYKCFFSLKTSSFTCIKYGFSLFFMPLKMKSLFLYSGPSSCTGIQSHWYKKKIIKKNQ